MPENTPTWEELEKGFTLRPSPEYIEEMTFVEAEVIETIIKK